MFDDILGHDAVKAYFTRGLKNQNLAHAMLLAGQSGIGKSLLAESLAAFLLHTTLEKIQSGNCPDFHSLKPEGKSGLHSIDSLRNLIEEVYSSSFGEFGKVFVIYGADRMQPASANAILKTLEEPNPDTTLVLLSEYPQEILPTIRSRCAYLPCKPLTCEQVEMILKARGLDKKWAKLSSGSIGRAIDLATKPSIEEPLISLLSQKVPYYKLLGELENLESLLNDEDPVKKNQNVEHLFACILMWYRDMEIVRENLDSKHLFFDVSKNIGLDVLSLEKISKKVELSRNSYQRNIKLSTCLESLFV